MNRHLWLIPSVIGVLFSGTIGVLAYIMYQIGQAPGFSFSMDPLFPLFFGGGLVLAGVSFKKWRNSEGELT